MIEPGGTYAFHFAGGDVVEGLVGDFYPTMVEVYNVDLDQRYLVPRFTAHLLYIEDLSDTPGGPGDDGDGDDDSDDDGPNGGNHLGLPLSEFTLLVESDGNDIYINGEKL